MTTHWLYQPWPWYVVGPLVGLMPATLLLLGNKLFGVSGNLRHLCAAVLPGRPAFLRYDWWQEGSWNLMLALGIVAGGFVGGYWLANPAPVALAPAALADLRALGLHDFTGLVPRELFAGSQLLSWRGLGLIVGGGFLVGFGTAYAGGCTSGHGIMGVADLQKPSFLALAAFFVGGILGTYVVLPWLLG
ncbi:YeeE/YedE family protein [Hymenobacter sp. J193]|uniref:YeeE/YedE family protein n=1 Tax=Hymenobacter sp. J193 TaxID=2898429 RepID=UPI00215161AC|nr:YeeE/YedE thiosulfate transporter family protein [Hymenobacter sp. J193]MCR5889162.1 YeeE/YedE family protein [Hymenobacter sp. J193]